MISIKSFNLEQYSYEELDKLYKHIGKMKHKLYQVRYRQKHRKEARAYAKIYREEHKEKIAKYNSKKYRMMKRSK